MLKFTVSPAECNLRFTCAVCLLFLSLPHARLSGSVFLGLQPLSRSLPSPHYSLKSSSSVRKLCISRQGGLTFVFARSDRGLCQILQTKLSAPRGAETCTARRGVPHQRQGSRAPGAPHRPASPLPGAEAWGPVSIALPGPRSPACLCVQQGLSSAARPVQAKLGSEDRQYAIPAVNPQTTAAGA